MNAYVRSECPPRGGRRYQCKVDCELLSPPRPACCTDCERGCHIRCFRNPAHCGLTGSPARKET